MTSPRYLGVFRFLVGGPVYRKAAPQGETVFELTTWEQVQAELNAGRAVSVHVEGVAS